MVLPDSYLNIHATHPSKFNSAIAAMRFHGVAFRADLASFGGGQTHPVRWSGQQADRIRPILAKEYLLLPRIQQLKLAYADVIIPDPTGPGEGSAALDDACIAKFAHEIVANRSGAKHRAECHTLGSTTNSSHVVQTTTRLMNALHYAVAPST